MHFLDWVHGRIAKIRQSRVSVRACVQCDNDGFTLEIRKGQFAGETQRLDWDRVAQVFAFKKDCFSIDQIRLAIENDIEQCIEITEDDEGYERLLELLPTYLAGFPSQEEWWHSVAFPAFETKWTRLYSRNSPERQGQNFEFRGSQSHQRS